MVIFIFFMAFKGEAGDVWKKVYDLADSKLAKLSTAPEVVNAVMEHNDIGRTIDQIHRIDKEWVKTKGVSDLMESLLTSPCAILLKKLQASAPYYAEIFVMGNQGGIVAMTNKTSDYWQADEAKFQKAFNQGKGRVFVGDVMFDDSTNTFLVHISVPVISSNRTIGAITFGIDMELFR